MTINQAPAAAAARTGQRPAGAGPAGALQPRVPVIIPAMNGSKMPGAVVNALYRTRYTDLCYGYNAFWASAIPAFRLTPDGTAKARGDGLEIETLISLRAAAAGLAVTEVPSYEHARIHGQSSLSTFRDGRRVLKTIITEWHNR